jgi:hypothetical protein
MWGRICSDSDVFLDFMETMYSRFKVEGFAPTQTLLGYHYYRGSDNPWGEPTLALAGETWHGRQVLGLAGYVYDGILNSILSSVRSHLLIHAGVVARQGKATIISADSGGGKTTIVLGLVQRGYDFLSDELAPRPPGRSGGSFLRCLRLRPGFHNLLSLPEPPSDAPLWFDKYLLDIEQSAGSRKPVLRLPEWSSLRKRIRNILRQVSLGRSWAFLSITWTRILSRQLVKYPEF